jgi:hypothetical protein
MLPGELRDSGFEDELGRGLCVIDVLCHDREHSDYLPHSTTDEGRGQVLCTWFYEGETAISDLLECT